MGDHLQPIVAEGYHRRADRPQRRPTFTDDELDDGSPRRGFDKGPGHVLQTFHPVGGGFGRLTGGLLGGIQLCIRDRLGSTASELGGDRDVGLAVGTVRADDKEHQSDQFGPADERRDDHTSRPGRPDDGRQRLVAAGLLA